MRMSALLPTISYNRVISKLNIVEPGVREVAHRRGPDEAHIAIIVWSARTVNACPYFGIIAVSRALCARPLLADVTRLRKRPGALFPSYILGVANLAPLSSRGARHRSILSPASVARGACRMACQS